jgi:hypothetical protein
LNAKRLERIGVQPALRCSDWRKFGAGRFQLAQRPVESVDRPVVRQHHAGLRSVHPLVPLSEFTPPPFRGVDQLVQHVNVKPHVARASRGMVVH